jgi:hypothetical protein
MTTAILGKLIFAQQNCLDIPDSKFDPNLSMNMENVGGNSPTNLIKVWLPLGQFSKNLFLTTRFKAPSSYITTHIIGTT